MFDATEVIDVNSVGRFTSDPHLIERAVYLLQDAGFEVLQTTSFMINICGSRETYETAFSAKLVLEEKNTIKERGREDKATFIDCADSEIDGLIPTAGTRFEEVLEGVALEEPRYFDAAASLPPPVDYWHLDVPSDVSLGCNAEKAHRAGTTGRGIKVAMVDSGWFRHPYFVARGYRSASAVLGPGASNAASDESGHGTGESANVFSVAPDCELLPVKATLSGNLNTVLVNATGAFNAAAALNPRIITNSWGFNVRNGPLSAAEQALATSVAAAVASGIVTVFSAGNGLKFGFPGQHPDVISVGGVFMERDGSLQASSYAAGFNSNIYAGRRVPDVSGLVGMDPGASYIMLPVPEGCDIDRGRAGGSHPPGDETPDNDGWAAFSGTSAAAPQVAGAAALILQACPRLTPAEVKGILMRTSRDVTSGTNSMGQTAAIGPDTATGNGLIDAARAVLIAKLRCQVFPVQPIRPTIPFFPFRPPVQPLQPVFPVRPAHPIFPVTPLQPFAPTIPFGPVDPVLPFGPGPGPGFSDAQGLSAEDLENLEQMIIESEGDDFGL